MKAFWHLRDFWARPLKQGGLGKYELFKWAKHWDVKYDSERDKAGEKPGLYHWGFVCSGHMDLILYVHTSQNVTCMP